MPELCEECGEEPTTFGSCMCEECHRKFEEEVVAYEAMVAERRLWLAERPQDESSIKPDRDWLVYLELTPKE